jgi:hypothetical protein
MIAVTKVTPLKNGLLHITLSNGSSGVFNSKPYCTSDYFKELLHDEYFRQVRLFFRGIGWPHGQDFGPDTLAEDLVDSESIVTGV